MSSRPRRSPIWINLSDDEFTRLFNNSETITEILAFFDLLPKGGNGKTLKERCEKLGLDYDEKARWGRGRAARLTYDNLPGKVFCEHSKVKRSGVKRRIIRQNLLPYCCSLCQIGPWWDGKPLTLILDHINGVPDDHRIENLRFVCPNCNSQLDTHAGRNKRIRG